jgi:hypothetical protein
MWWNGNRKFTGSSPIPASISNKIKEKSMLVSCNIIYWYENDKYKIFK